MRHFLTLFFLWVAFLSFGQDGLVINEIMSDNESTLMDGDGDFSDWIELYNSGDAAVDLNNYGLSDEEDDPFKWIFPPYIIEPGSYLIVFASDKGAVPGELHANFKISSDGEPILLTKPDGTLIDIVKPTPLTEDVSFGRMPNGFGAWERLYEANPELSNTLSPGIIFTHHSGFYSEAIDLNMGATNGHQIRYTVDGSIPNPTSTLYLDALELGSLDAEPDDISLISTSPYWSSPTTDNYKAHVIRAATFNDGVQTSNTYSKVIFIQPDLNERYADFDLVSIVIPPGSLFDEDTGIYVPGVHFSPGDVTWSGNYFEKGELWEREANLQYFNSAGTLEFEQEVGIRTHGGKGRNLPQKSLRIYTRGERGAPKLNHPFFQHLGEEKAVFDKVVLRNSMTCWNHTVIKDEVTAEVCHDLNFETQHSKPVVVFINGEYWGVQSIREYYDQKFVAERYDVPEDSVNIVLHGSSNHPDLPEDWGTVEGNNDGHVVLYDFLNANDLDIPENYDYVKSMLDMESIIDYYCTEIYFNNKDWPTNNNKLWMNGSFGTWRQMLYDMDGGWKYLGTDYNQLWRALSPSGSGQNAPYATLLLRKLVQSPEFLEQFLERMACLMKTNFEAENVVAIITYMQGLYESGMHEHVDRWHRPSSYGTWTAGINGLIEFANGRKAHMINHIETQFGIDFDPDLYDCEVIIDDSNIEENEDPYEVKIYPNPTQQKSIWVDFDFTEDLIYYQFFNVAGVQLDNGLVGDHQEIQLDFAPGTYLLSLVYNQQKIVKRVVIL